MLPDSEDAKIKLSRIALDAYLLNRLRPKHLYEQLVKLSDQLLAKNPNSTEGLRIRGHLAVTDKKIKEAIAIFKAEVRNVKLPGDE